MQTVGNFKGTPNWEVEQQENLGYFSIVNFAHHLMAKNVTDGEAYQACADADERLMRGAGKLLAEAQTLTNVLTPLLYGRELRAFIDSHPEADDLPGAYAALCVAIAEVMGETR